MIIPNLESPPPLKQPHIRQVLIPSPTRRQELGKDNIDAAREYGKRMLRITMIVSLIGCVIILALRPLILDFYRDKLTETAIYL